MPFSRDFCSSLLIVDYPKRSAVNPLSSSRPQHRDRLNWRHEFIDWHIFIGLVCEREGPRPDDRALRADRAEMHEIAATLENPAAPYPLRHAACLAAILAATIG
jgi:hypothetical protein